MSVFKVDESVILEGDLKAISQAAIEEARRWVKKAGPERAAALAIYAKVFEQSIRDIYRARVLEIERQKQIDRQKQWESEALFRALTPSAQGWKETAPRKPQTQVVVAATLEELL